MLLSSQKIVNLNVRGIFKLARLYVYVTIHDRWLHSCDYAHNAIRQASPNDPATVVRSWGLIDPRGPGCQQVVNQVKPNVNTEGLDFTLAMMTSIQSPIALTATRAGFTAVLEPW